MKKILRGKKQVAVVKSALIALAIFGMGLLVIYWQSTYTLNKNSKIAVEEAIRQIDVMLENAKNAADKNLQLSNLPCVDAATRMRSVVAAVPFVRSASLAKNDNINCTSLFGDGYVEHIESGDYHGGLRLIGGNGVSSDRAVLVYRSNNSYSSSLVGVDGQYLKDALYLIAPESHLAIQVGSSWMTADGIVHSEPFLNLPVAQSSQSSSLFDITAYNGYPRGHIWRYAMDGYFALIVLVALLGAGAGLMAYWLLGRVLAPSSELKRALDANEFIPFVQPLVSTENLQWTGVEVLMRWKHPTEGLIRPDHFIPLAESCGLIVPMTRSLMRHAAFEFCRQTQNLPENFHISFNVCTAHFKDMNLVDDCREFLAAFEPNRVVLILELTERELIESNEKVDSVLSALQGMGVKIAIDDFGTGHSSLSYLQAFKVDYLKIDKSFVSMIGVEALSVHILDSIIELATKLGLVVVAEGVETSEQSSYLSSKGVHYLQGYFFAKPMGIDKFLKRSLET